MAFSCTYDSATTNLPISVGDLIENIDATTLVNAVTELKTYLNSQGGYSEGINNVINWGANANIIDHDLVNSVRSTVENIDATTYCTCNYVCSGDNICACNSQTSSCSCQSQSFCSPNCGSNSTYVT